MWKVRHSLLWGPLCSGLKALLNIVLPTGLCNPCTFFVRYKGPPREPEVEEVLQDVQKVFDSGRASLVESFRVC